MHIVDEPRKFSPSNVLTYTVYAVCLGVTGSIVIVLTPLISLMIDQKDMFIKRGIRAEFVGQAQDDERAIAAVKRRYTISIH